MQPEWNLQFHRNLFSGLWEIRKVRWFEQDDGVGGSEVIASGKMPITWLARSTFQIDA